MQQIPGHRTTRTNSSTRQARLAIDVDKHALDTFSPTGKLHEILDALPMFVYLLASNYTFKYVNSGFMKEFGIPDQFTRCYAMMRKSHHPCDDCPAMSVLADRQRRVWRWHDALRGKTYQIHDLLYDNDAGSNLVLGIGINVNDLDQSPQQPAVRDAACQDIIKICCYCKNIFNPSGSWQQLEAYFHQTRGMHFSHSICSACMKIHHQDLLAIPDE